MIWICDVNSFHSTGKGEKTIAVDLRTARMTSIPVQLRLTIPGEQESHGIPCLTAQEPWDSCTAIKEPWDSCTAIKEPWDSCTALKEPWDSCTAIKEPWDSCTAIKEPWDCALRVFLYSSIECFLWRT
eukprot:gene15810-biopygen4405